jgi:transposase-like protein
MKTITEGLCRVGISAGITLIASVRILAKSFPELFSFGISSICWMEENLAEGFSVFDFPLEHRRTIRTINSLEWINKEIRRRTKAVGVFPNEASCLRLISAILMEISEEWQIGKHYCAGKSLNY